MHRGVYLALRKPVEFKTSLQGVQVAHNAGCNHGYAGLDNSLKKVLAILMFSASYYCHTPAPGVGKLFTCCLCDAHA
jgi:hypothetical protein